jgi:hypothetical protein
MSEWAETLLNEYYTPHTAALVRHLGLNGPPRGWAAGHTGSNNVTAVAVTSSAEN